MDGRKSEEVTRLILYLKYIIIQLQVRQKWNYPSRCSCWHVGTAHARNLRGGRGAPGEANNRSQVGRRTTLMGRGAPGDTTKSLMWSATEGVLLSYRNDSGIASTHTSQNNIHPTPWFKDTMRTQQRAPRQYAQQNNINVFQNKISRTFRALLGRSGVIRKLGDFCLLVLLRWQSTSRSVSS